jgi:hypothetical protein
VAVRRRSWTRFQESVARFCKPAIGVFDAGLRVVFEHLTSGAEQVCRVEGPRDRQNGSTSNDWLNDDNPAEADLFSPRRPRGSHVTESLRATRPEQQIRNQRRSQRTILREVRGLLHVGPPSGGSLASPSTETLCSTFTIS